MTAIILDTETTDLGGIMIELAWKNINTHETFEQRYNPKCRISKGASAVHQIFDKDVFDKPCHTTVSIPSDVRFIFGHNINFDLRVLRRSGIDTSRFKAICTLKLARKAFPNFKSYSLSQLMFALFDLDVAERLTANAHQAMADIQMTELLLEQIVKKLDIPMNAELIYAVQE